MTESLSLFWCIPFVGMLLSIALGPMVFSRFWHRHYGKIGGFWTLLFILPWARFYGIDSALDRGLHAIFYEYLPFTSLIAALFTITGGIQIRAQWLGTPTSNMLILLAGTIMASWIGTTGAAMLLVRPLIRANSWRHHNVHIKVFFIFLVANIGGALTPLGDPPLFIGYLNGVDFFWTTKHLLAPMLVMAVPLLLIFLGIDGYYFKKESRQAPSIDLKLSKLSIDGAHNFIYLGALLGIVLASGSLQFDATIDLLGHHLPLVNFIRDASLWGLCFLSMLTTKKHVREENRYSWAPFLEVAKLFFAIFITVIPVILILQEGAKGSLAPLVNLVTGPDGLPIAARYFWITGLLSGFLDNAPTYMVYFHTAGGDAQLLMNGCCKALMAISAGAVFMGAITYIGNAPNFMVKAIAEEQGIRMPSFFGYMGWSMVLLLPLFLLVTFIFF